MKRIKVYVCVAMLGLAQPIFAQALDGNAAKKALFAPDEVGVQVMKQSFLVDDQAQILASVATQQPYYGAIAVSPADGLMAESTLAAANYHSIEAASVAALAGCDAARKGDAPCVIVALIRPKGWEARPLQLSADATGAFRVDYAGKGGALAVSANTGAWAMAKGKDASNAAIAACGAKVSGQNDCSVIISD